VGLEPPTVSALDDAHEALGRGETYGDNFAMACALWECGTVLLRIDRPTSRMGPASPSAAIIDFAPATSDPSNGLQLLLVRPYSPR
jgi:hypothetical protein